MRSKRSLRMEPRMARGWRCDASRTAIRGIRAASIRFRRAPGRAAMDNYRLALLFALALIVVSIWRAWVEEHPTAPQAPAAQTAPTAQQSTPDAAVPNAPAA